MELRRALKSGQLGGYALGMLGSLVIIKIMRRPTFRSMPRSLVYTALASVNLLFLIYVTMTSIYDIVEGKDPTVSNIYMCTINFPVSGFFTHMDAWLLAVLTSERVLCVVRPFHIKQIVTRFRTKVLLSTLTLFFLIWNAELAFRTKLLNVTDPKTNVTKQICQVSVDNYGLPPIIFVIKGIITTVLLRTVLPVVVIIPSNLVIIVKLLRQKQARSNMTNTPAATDSQTQKTTWMIVSASISFVIMSTPLSIYLMIIYKEIFHGEDQILPILALIYRLSPVVNFYCYFLSGGLFKEEVKKWLSELLPDTVWSRAAVETGTCPPTIRPSVSRQSGHSKDGVSSVENIKIKLAL